MDCLQSLEKTEFVRKVVENMAKVVYVDWKDRQFEPEIVGVYENESKGYEARENKEYELREEGYDTDEEVRVWIEDIEITR